ncbi:dentin matrix acidic phosphoprotein 1 [Ctenodactylus gundi]
MKSSLLLVVIWGLSCALPVAKYQNTETESSEEWKGHLSQSPAPPVGNSESSEESKVSSEEQAREEPSDSTETGEHLSVGDDHFAYRPASGLSRSAGKAGEDKEDDEDDSGDDTFSDEDNVPGPEEGRGEGISQLGSDEDSTDTTQSREDNTSQEESGHNSASESRDLDNRAGMGSRSKGGDATLESESEEGWMGDSSHRTGLELDDEGMQSDDPDGLQDSAGSEGGRTTTHGAQAESKGSNRDSELRHTQNAGDRPSVVQPRRKFLRKSHISEEDDAGHPDDSNTTEDRSDSQEAGPSQSWEGSKSDSPEDSGESQSQEDSHDGQDTSSESSQEDDLPSQESSSESQEEAAGESRGDSPGYPNHSADQADSDSSEEDSLDTLFSSESQSTEEQADSQSSESLGLSKESEESTESANSSSQEGPDSPSASTESQNDQSQSQQDSRSEEEADSDSQDSSSSKEDSTSTESTSSSEEAGQPKNLETEGRKLVVDDYHKPNGDQDDNDCQDGY